LVLLAVLFQIFPDLYHQYRANVVFEQLLNHFKIQHSKEFYDCISLKPAEYPDFSVEQRLTAGSIFLSAGCLDLADHVLPEFTDTSNRADFLAYQLGWAAWERGDSVKAATLWRQGQGIGQYLVLQAQQAQPKDINLAMQLYEIAIISANTDQMLAEALWAYTSGMGAKVEKNIFNERLAALSAHFGPDTAMGHRLEGQRLIRNGNLTTAFTELSKAIDLGLTDSETWYLLGFTAWKLDDLESAEYAYRKSLDSPTQVSERRPWYLYQMASLLALTGRPNEALLFQEEAANLNKYYLHQDFLAVLYTRVGEYQKAQQACEMAKILAGQTIAEFLCENP